MSQLKQFKLIFSENVLVIADLTRQ